MTTVTVATPAEWPKPLTPQELQLGADPETVRAELLWAIRRHIVAHPRSAQTIIGPSELGMSCQRRLALKLSGAPSARAVTASWRPTVGTAVHAWLAEAFDNLEAASPGRWATERRVCVGTVAGQDIWGSCDLYDRVTGTVIDWKVVGVTSLRKARREGASQQYRTQLHLYGRGWRRVGLPVEQVAIMYLPSSGELAEAEYWHERFDETVATQALSRAEALLSAVRLAGAEVVVPALPTADSFCTGCPWFTPSQNRTSLECPGHAALERERNSQ